MAEHSDALKELLAVFSAAQKNEREWAPYVVQAIPAGQRLAAFIVDNIDLSDQAQTILKALASVYNGSDAAPVRLDELRWLEWHHQRDLIAVIIGTGSAETPDTHIRDAFSKAGGSSAVELLHAQLKP